MILGRSYLLVLAIITATACAAPPDDEWKMEVLHLKSGGVFKGLVAKESAKDLVFWRVSRKPGAHTTVIVATIDRKEIDHVDALDAKERDALAARLKALDPTGRGEVQRMASLTLETGDWGTNGKGKARIYRSEQFLLESNAEEDIVRRVAVRLEHLYAATTRFLPPRVESAEPTHIYLARSLADYQDLLRAHGHNALVNPAIYDMANNQIYCGSDLQRLGESLEAIRKQHQQLLAELSAKETELNKLYKGRVPARLLTPIRQSRQEIAQNDDKNERLFQEATARLFQRLNHEAFHAYLATFVYPPEEADVPRWLNEGLAQIFETAIVEAGELRVGHPDRERTRRVQSLLKNDQLMELTTLLKSGPKQFLVEHATEKQLSDKYYLASWALAFYLTFERRLLGSKAMDEYVQALHRGGDPLAAFKDFVNQPVEGFEKDFRAYLMRLPAGK
jgi:hypothetical protein